jgi:hypothetical protein
MSNHYKPFGCFNNIKNNAFHTNMSQLYNKEYTIKECNNLAIQNNSNVFGIVKNSNINNDTGICFLSDEKMDPLKQYYNAVQNGISIDGCSDGFGNIQNNNVFIYLNNKALTFFNDLSSDKINNETYLNKLKKLNTDFTDIFNLIEKEINQKLKPYEPNNMEELFITPNIYLINSIKNKYKTLDTEINLKNKINFEKIQEINNEITNLNNHINKTKKYINNITTSDDASLGEIKDMNFRKNSIIGQNIIFFTIPLILIMLFLNEKKIKMS